MRRRCAFTTLSIALACWVGAVSGSEGDGHPEYLALYSLGVGGSHTLQLGGAGEESSVEFMVVPSSSADQEGLEEAEGVSASAWEEFSSGSEAPTSLLDGSSVVPSRSVVYTVSLLTSESSSAVTATTTNQPIVAVPLAIPEAGAYTLLLNHGEIPAVVVSPTGETLVPVVSEEDGHEEDDEDEEAEGASTATARQWANALAASFLISLCSFAGIVTVVSSRVAHKIDLPLAFLFASGALLTTAVVHIIPEAMQGLAPEYSDDLHGLFLRSGVSIMAGIFGAFLLHVMLDNGAHHSHHSSEAQLQPRATVSAAAGPSGDGNNAAAVVMEGGKTEAIAVARGNKGHGEGEASVGSLTGNENPVAPAAPAAVGGVYKASLSKIADGNERGCGGSDRTVGATACSGKEGTITEDCSDDSRECAGDQMEEGRQRRRRRRPNDDAFEVAAEEGKPTTTTAVLSDEAARAFPPAGVVMSSLRHAKRVGADRGLFDFAGLDPVCWNVVCGDIAHNFSDGVTMAAAFLGCSLTVGWTVMAANMMHEIPHEVGNFMALVNGGMSVKQALLYNFLSALFTVFGVVLTFSLREVITAAAISYLLLIGSGTFIFVGLSELVPDALKDGGATWAIAGKTEDRHYLHRRMQARKALAFAVGAGLLGLPLLAHTHCGADEGHGHR